VVFTNGTGGKPGRHDESEVPHGDAHPGDRRRASPGPGPGARPEVLPGGLRYRLASGEFALFASAGAPSGEHTQLAFEVDDIEAVVSELRARGVEFESFDFPGLSTVEGIADIDGNYPSKGAAERGAWFRDSEGNLLGIGQPVA
jgi:hypothetical protein